MQHPFLIGKRLYLRALETADLDGPYLDWLNDHTTMRFLDSGRFPTSRQVLEGALQSKSTDSVLLAIVDRETNRHIGNIKLGPINWIHRFGSIGILLGEPAFRGKGYGREALELVVRHAFEQLGLNKLTAGAYADHAACLALFQQVGFSIEGRLPGHLYREGAYHDKVVMGLRREQFLTRPAARPAAAHLPASRRRTGRRVAAHV